MTNPLNIDFAAIIQCAERRRMNLEAISQLIGHQAPVIYRELNNTRSTLEILVEHYKALDPEGKELLPADVKQLLSLSNTHLGQVETMLSSYHVAGWKDLAAKYGLLKEEPVGAKLAHVGRGDTYESGELLKPIDAVHTAHGNVEIVWDPREFDAWPDGHWVARRGFSESGHGVNPNDAYLDWQSRNQ